MACSRSERQESENTRWTQKTNDCTCGSQCDTKLDSLWVSQRKFEAKGDTTHLKDLAFLIVIEIGVLDTDDLLVCKYGSEGCGKDFPLGM